MPLALEERVDTLEAVLGEFIVSTGRALTRMERGISNLKDEVKVLKDEMRDFKDEVKVFKDEMLAFKDEVKVFKDEMLAFKDEMLAFKDEMKVFKDEMLAFKDEMRDFKDEMKVFKDEMLAFKDESRIERKEMQRKWGDLANKMGTIVEDIVAPNVPGIARTYFGIDGFDFFGVRVRKRGVRDRSLVREFDVVASSDNEIIIVEVKSTPRQGYVDEFIGLLKEIEEYFPEAGQRRLIPIFASLYLPENIVKYLSRNGIYAMGMKDDTMDLLNFDDVSKGPS